MIEGVHDPVVRAFADTALHSAGLPPASTSTAGGTQILRFRTPTCQMKPKKQKAAGESKGDTLHMHVDQDSDVDQVVLISIGCTSRMAIDDRRTCQRIDRCEMNMVTAHNKDLCKEPCKTCQVVEVKSGQSTGAEMWKSNSRVHNFKILQSPRIAFLRLKNAIQLYLKLCTQELDLHISAPVD